MSADIGVRLREERLRLGLHQTAFAALAGCSKSAVVSWEQGRTTPTATALAGLSAAGADVLYIVTGATSRPASPPPPPTPEEAWRAARALLDQIAPDMRELLVEGWLAQERRR